MYQFTAQTNFQYQCSPPPPSATWTCSTTLLTWWKTAPFTGISPSNRICQGTTGTNFQCISLLSPWCHCSFPFAHISSKNLLHYSDCQLHCCTFCAPSHHTHYIGWNAHPYHSSILHKAKHHSSLFSWAGKIMELCFHFHFSDLEKVVGFWKMPKVMGK